MEKDLPTQARAVIIGGGIVGCSVAYHLTKLGWNDVVVLEQGRLSGGTTWHAAGLVGQLRSHHNMTSLIRYSTELYGALEAETGLATGWTRCGSLTVARTADRMILLRRTAALARAFGVEAEVITPEDAGRKWPVMRTDDLIGAIWLPGDGKANPTDLTQALARGARMGGARIFEKTRVTGITVADGAAAGVRTDAGHIGCGAVLGICGGYQMLGQRIGDPDGIEGMPGNAPGLGLLDVETELSAGKTLTEVAGTEPASGEPVAGYEMHIGRTTGPDTRRPMLDLETGAEGAISADGRVRGCYVHGLFAKDPFRHAFLSRLKDRRASGLAYEEELDQVLDGLADHLEAHLQVDRILEVAGVR